MTSTKSFAVTSFSMNGDQHRQTYANKNLAEGRADLLNRSGGRIAIIEVLDEPFESSKAKDYFKRGDR